MQLVAAASLDVDSFVPGCRVNTFNERKSIFSAQKFTVFSPIKKKPSKLLCFINVQFLLQAAIAISCLGR